jgi:hypothetical protein
VEKRRGIGQSIFNEDPFPHHKTAHYQGDLFLFDENPSLEMMIQYPLNFSFLKKLTIHSNSIKF